MSTLPRGARRLGCLLAACLGLACSARPSVAPGAPPLDSFRIAIVPVVAGDGPEEVSAARVTAEFFPAAGVAPLLGRPFLPSEFHSPPAPVAILHHDYWQERFGGAPSIIGRTVEINRLPMTVVAIMPRGFDVPAGVRLWMPSLGR